MSKTLRAYKVKDLVNIARENGIKLKSLKKEDIISTLSKVKNLKITTNPSPKISKTSKGKITKTAKVSKVKIIKTAKVSKSRKRITGENVAKKPMDAKIVKLVRVMYYVLDGKDKTAIDNSIANLQKYVDEYDWRGYENLKKQIENKIKLLENKARAPVMGKIVPSKIPNVQGPTKIQNIKKPYVPGVYKLLDDKINVVEKGENILEQNPVAERIAITLEEFIKEIENPIFIKRFAESSRKLMKAKENVYNKKLEEMKKEYRSLNVKVSKLRISGIKDDVIKDMYPGYDKMYASIIDLEDVIELVKKKGESVNEKDIKEGLEEAIYDPDNGINSLMGRKNIKDQIVSQLYSFSKGYKTFFENFNNIMIAGPAGSGKCLDPDTEVLMYDGTIKLAKNIQIGDRLMGDDSTPRHVLSTCCGVDDMYKVVPLHDSCPTANTSDAYVVNAPHILCVTDGVEIIDIPVTEYIKKDDEWKKKYKGYKVPVDFNYANSTENCENFYQKGLKIATEQNIPHHYKTSSKQNRLKLLAGIIDWCGTHPTVGESMMYVIKNITGELAKDIVYVARSCGFASYQQEDSIYITGNLHDIPTILCPRYMTNVDEDFLLTPLKIEYVGKGNYCGFEIDGNRRFLLGNFTVTHNTRLAKTIAFAFSKSGILGRDVVKVVTRTELVGQYIGQTAPRTRGALLESLEGILFIDEAYQLTPCLDEDKGSKDFGSEAITEMVNFLDKYISLNIVIVAGYENLMNRCFMTANEGLPRRFPYRYILSSYTASELTDILVNNLKRKTRDEVIIDQQTADLLYTYLVDLMQKYPDIFKNQAGDMLNLSSKINNAINSSYHIDWKNGDIKNNKKIILTGFDEFLYSKGYIIKV